MRVGFCAGVAGPRSDCRVRKGPHSGCWVPRGPHFGSGGLAGPHSGFAISPPPWGRAKIEDPGAQRDGADGVLKGSAPSTGWDSLPPAWTGWGKPRVQRDLRVAPALAATKRPTLARPRGGGEMAKPEWGPARPPERACSPPHNQSQRAPPRTNHQSWLASHLQLQRQHQPSPPFCPPARRSTRPRPLRPYPLQQCAGRLVVRVLWHELPLERPP
jgi:hypothetical protein